MLAKFFDKVMTDIVLREEIQKALEKKRKIAKDSDEAFKVFKARLSDVKWQEKQLKEQVAKKVEKHHSENNSWDVLMMSKIKETD